MVYVWKKLHLSLGATSYTVVHIGIKPPCLKCQYLIDMFLLNRCYPMRLWQSIIAQLTALRTWDFSPRVLRVTLMDSKPSLVSTSFT